MEYKAEDVRTISDAFRDGLQAILGSKLFGVYLYGALAFPEAAPTGDIDFHVILKETLTDDEQSAWRYSIDLARKAYAGQGTAQERELMLAEIDGLLEFAQAYIQASRQVRQRQGAAGVGLRTADL